MPIADVLQTAAAMVLSLSVLGAAAWRLVRPHVRDYVQTQQAAAQQLQRNGGNSVADKAHQAADATQNVVASLQELRGLAYANQASLADLQGRVSTHKERNAESVAALQARVDRIEKEQLARVSEGGTPT